MKKGLIAYNFLRNEANQNKQIIFIHRLFIWFVGIICSPNSHYYMDHSAGCLSLIQGFGGQYKFLGLDFA